jgi:predicted NAD/FAD-dependent oxidoreductase
MPPHVIKAHRWRFALPEIASNEGCMFDAELAIGGCGDWCHSARVEGAFTSGLELANRIRQRYP